MTDYFRPLLQHGTARPEGALTLAGGALWFTHVEAIRRDAAPRVLPAEQADAATLARLCAPRAPVLGLDMAQPHVMGIVNVTPDSFSDGGRHYAPEAAVQGALAMMEAGASLLDIGGESTRPGSETVPPEDEIARIRPVIEGIRRAGTAPISVDTRKARVAEAAIGAGADLINDVSGFEYDPALAPYCAGAGLPVCLMHAQGDPATMQANPRYDNVLLDVYDYLAARLDWLEGLGLPRSQVLLDPGIGFGKTVEHNLTLLRNIALFHALGAPILLGVSRKKFVGTIGQEPQADRRGPGSVAVGLAALAQGVQILRVHDVPETVQAVRLWQAVR